MTTSLRHDRALAKYHLAPVDDALTEFQQAYPAFGKTSMSDDSREREYGLLDKQRQVYLEHTLQTMMSSLALD